MTDAPGEGEEDSGYYAIRRCHACDHVQGVYRSDPGTCNNCGSRDVTDSPNLPFDPDPDEDSGEGEETFTDVAEGLRGKSLEDFRKDLGEIGGIALPYSRSDDAAEVEEWEEVLVYPSPRPDGTTERVARIIYDDMSDGCPPWDELTDAWVAKYMHTATRILATLSTPREPEVGSLEYRIGVQNGGAGTWEEGEEAEHHARKVTWNDCRFGAPVEIRFRWEDGDNGDEWSEHGYLTTLPEYTEPDMDGVIHLPEVTGEKQAGGPIWITVLDAAALPDVVEVIVGERAAPPPDSEVREEEES